jgi:hypothetical protein
MRRTVRTVTAILFAAIVVGCAFAVLYLGTSTGLTFGGGGSELRQASKTDAVYAQVGWLRNTSPWPITIQSITTNEVGTAQPTTVMLERSQSGSKVSTGARPNCAINASRSPYQLDGGALRYLGFAVHAGKDSVGYMTSVTVHYTGPLGIPFTSRFSGTTVVAEASTLPTGIIAKNPTTDSTALDTYVAALRNVLLQTDPAVAAAVMGGGATEADGKAFLTKEVGYLTSDAVKATPVPGDLKSQKIVFYSGDPTKGLPPISVTWSDYRWTVDR